MGIYFDLVTKAKSYNREMKRLREAIAMGDKVPKGVVTSLWRWQATFLRDNYNRFIILIRYTKDLVKYRNRVIRDIRDKEAYIERLKREEERIETRRQRIYNQCLCDDKEEKELIQAINRRQEDLKVQEKKLMDLKQEYIVKQEELEDDMRALNLAKSSYYRLSDAEMALFETERGKILAGVEKFGSVAAAVRNDGSIKMRVSSILHYAKKHKQFGEDLAIAKQCFKENLDAVLVDRALNGTVNPVFQRGEHLGDFAIKDNKLLVEVAKAKLPEQYNPRAYAQAHPQSAAGTTINILSFDGVDETKKGYARNIGVVKSVDDTGRVERITQQKKDAQKMLEFYKNKEGVEIIEAEVVDDNKSVE